MNRKLGLVLLLAALSIQCGTSSVVMGGADSGTGMDAGDDGGTGGMDAGDDAGTGGMDAGDDAGAGGMDAGDDAGTGGTDAGTGSMDAGDDAGTGGIDAGDDAGTGGIDAGDDAGNGGMDAGDDAGTSGMDAGDDAGTDGMDAGDDAGTGSMDGGDDAGAGGMDAGNSDAGSDGGSSDAGEPDDGGSEDAGVSDAGVQACSDRANATCTLRDTCSGDYNIDKNFADEPTCVARLTANCEAELELSDTGQTPANIESCVAAYPSYACADYYNGNPPAACETPAGAVVDGSPCSAHSECASTFCRLTAKQVCGTCQPIPSAGMTCTVQADCGPSLACAMAASATSGLCAAYVTAGNACLTATNPCGAGLSCVGEKAATSTQGVCTAAITQVGAACDGNHKKTSDCDPDLGLTCIPTGASSALGTCAAIQLVAEGEACGKSGSPVTSVIDCAAGGQCIKASGSTTGTCAAVAADGAACDSDNSIGPPCLEPAKCVPAISGATAGICTLPDSVSCE